MSQKGHVPKFGNWDSDSNVPYTQYFDNARKGRGGGKMINPNDPQENPDAFSEDAPQVHAPTLTTGSHPEAPKSKQDYRASKEDGDLHQYTGSPLRHDAISRKASSDSPHHHHGDRAAADPQRRAGRTSVGSDRSIEQSPLHPHYQVKTASRGGISSPSWERKGSSEGGHGLGSNTPGRSRMRPSGRGDETPERSSAVPRFGEWDESDPSSADDFSHIFNKVREEKQTGSAKVPVITNDNVYTNGYKKSSSSASTGCWCFGWGKK